MVLKIGESKTQACDDKTNRQYGGNYDMESKQWQFFNCQPRNDK
jgi:hypothetical protein